MEFKKQLFLLETDKINVNIRLGFNNEMLVLDGYDFGKTVQEFKDSASYEYQVTVKNEALTKLYTINKIEEGQKQQLVDALSIIINGNTSYTLFKKYLLENDIKFESYVG